MNEEYGETSVQTAKPKNLFLMLVIFRSSGDTRGHLLKNRPDCVKAKVPQLEQMQVNTAACKEEAIHEHGPDALLSFLGQGSFHVVAKWKPVL